MGSPASNESAVNGQGSKTRWTPDEDKRLIKLVEKRGAKDWAYISQYFPDRTGKSCRLRWFNQLSPDVDSRPFTPDEDDIIINAHAKLGTRWSVISRMLVGRTDNAVKNHWNSALRRRLSHTGGSSSDFEHETNPPPAKRASVFGSRADFARSGLSEHVIPSPLVETEPIPYSSRPTFRKFSYPGPSLLPSDQEATPRIGLSLFAGSDLGEPSNYQAPPPPSTIPHHGNGNGKQPVEMTGINPYLLRMMESSATPLPQSLTPPPPPQESQWMIGRANDGITTEGENIKRYQKMLQDVTMMEVQKYVHNNGGFGGQECFCSIDDIVNAVMHHINSK